jgi:Tol biopolymer transport system component
MPPVVSGTRLGPYEIISRVGAGGMGEVFRARDTRLDRTVAIKVLPPEFADNAQLRVRFEREAKSISQMNHPNICTIHDVGNAEGVEYLVLEFLEGETLADRIAHGPLPVGDVLRYGAQIASALDRAHRSGIVHRDLKPGNVMVTKSGAKLLDFGLARTSTGAIASSETPDATQHKPLTQEGTLLGTFQYMSPEQLAGEEADERSDIFALGAVLYEMLTGVRAFDGKSRTSIIAAIVAGEPRPPSALRDVTPAALEHVIAKCLAKERDDRWQSAADVASELEWIASAPSGELARAGAIPHVKRSLTIPALALAAAVLAAAIAAGIYVTNRLRTAEQPLHSELLPDDTLTVGMFGAIALSPDGKQLAMLVGPPGKPSIEVRNLATGDSKKLPGTEGAIFPFWSPDSQRIGFFAGGKMKAIGANGISTQVICDAKQGRGGSWSPQGVIVFAPSFGSTLFKVADSGGSPVEVTQMQGRNPAFLPNGKEFLFSARPAPDGEDGVYAGSIDGKRQKSIVPNASNAAYSSGYLFFVRDGNLLSQKFDPRTWDVSGPVIPIADHVEYYKVRAIANFSVTPSKMVYASEALPSADILVVERSGRMTQVTSPAPFRILDVSSDDRTIVVTANEHFEQGDLWLLNIDSGKKSRVTFTNGGGLSGAFSPDGSHLAFGSGVFGRMVSLSVRSLVGNDLQKIIELPTALIVTQWSRDGRYVIVTTQNIRTGFDIQAVDMSTHEIKSVVQGPSDEYAGALSPNGKWLAYVSAESGTPQVYVTSFPGGDGKYQATLDGGAGPRWSRDGKQLYYVKDERVVAVDFRDAAVPEFGQQTKLPVPVMSDPMFLASSCDYAVTADGRFITRRSAAETPRALTLISNWYRTITP